MKIGAIKITQDELNEAVEQWLTTKHNITVPVEAVTRSYSWDDYTVDLDLGEKELPAPKDETPITPAL